MQQIASDIAEFGRGVLFLVLRVGGLLREIQFRLNLGGLVDFTVHLDAAKQQVIAIFTVVNLNAFSLVQFQFFRLFTGVGNHVAERQPIGEFLDLF